MFEKQIAELRTIFGFDTEVLRQGFSYLDTEAYSNLRDVARYALHFEICVLLKDGYSNDVINLEGIPTSTALHIMTQHGVTGGLPDLLYKFEHDSYWKTLELTTTTGDMANAFMRKQEKGRNEGRPYDTVVVCSLHTGEIEIHGDYKIDDIFKDQIRERVLDFYPKWQALFKDVAENVDMTDDYMKVNEILDPYRQSTPKEEILLKTAEKYPIERLQPLVYDDIKHPEWNKSNVMSYITAPFPVTESGLEMKVKLPFDVAILRPLFASVHSGYTRRAGKDDAISARTTMTTIGNSIIEMLKTAQFQTDASKDSIPTYGLATVDDPKLLLGENFKYDIIEDPGEFHMPEPVADDHGILNIGGLLDFWIKPAQAPGSHRENADPAERISDTILQTWWATWGGRYFHAGRRLVEDIFATGQNPTPKGTFKIYPIYRHWNGVDWLGGFIVMQQLHTHSTGNPKNPSYLSITFHKSDCLPEACWNKYMYEVIAEGTKCIMCISFSTFNVAKWRNMIGADRQECAAVARITAYMIANSEWEFGENLTNKHLELATSSVAMYQFSWMLLQFIARNNVDEGTAPVLRNYLKARIASIYGWEPYIINNKDIRKKLFALDYSNRFHFDFYWATGEEIDASWEETLWYKPDDKKDLKWAKGHTDGYFML